MSNLSKELLKLPTSNYISNSTIARSLVDNALESHAEYHSVIRACQKHISGEKPLPPDKLKKMGMAWSYNYNYNKASAKIEKGVADSTAKISASLALGYVTFREGKDSDLKDGILKFLDNNELRGIVAGAIGYALYSTMAKEPRLTGWLNEIEYPTYAFGYCALVFSEFDWMPTPTPPLSIVFRPKTRPDSINTWITFQTVDAMDLYDRWITGRNEKIKSTDEDGEVHAIASSGWNIAALEEVLLKAYRGKLSNGNIAESWEQVIPDYVSDSSSVISQTDSVNIAKIFNKEIDGTLTETYITYDNSWANQKTNSISEVNNIIYTKSHGKYNQSKHITLIRDSGFTVDSPSIQDLRGIAKYSVEDSIRYNRLRNGIGNKMQFIGAPMFEQSNTGSGDKFKVTVSQGFVLLPASHNLIEKQPSFDIGSHISVLQFEENEFGRDTQQFDPSIQGRLTTRPNKSEVNRVTSEIEMTDSAKNAIKFRDYSNTFLSVLKRLPSVKTIESDPGYDGKKMFYDAVKKAVSFIETDADVNKVLGAIDSFSMEPIVGNMETLTIAMQMAETPFARNRLKRMFLVAKGLPIEEVNLAVPLTADKNTNLQDERVAAFENDMFFTTNEVIVSGTDDHIVHLDSHITKSARVIRGVQQGAIRTIDAFKYLENILPHCLQHWQMLMEDPIYNSKAKEYEVALSEINTAKNNIKSAAEQEMQAAQEEQQKLVLDPKTEAEIANNNAKTLSDTQRKDWIAQQRTEQRYKQMDLNHQARLREIELKSMTDGQ
jgi:hypothetical protein